MREETLRESLALVEGEDFYREGAAIVFTARYHLRRGYCCESGCRHCPFRDGAETVVNDKEEAVEEVVE
jgi:2-iminoacetate synthase ThiH